MSEISNLIRFTKDLTQSVNRLICNPPGLPITSGIPTGEPEGGQNMFIDPDTGTIYYWNTTSRTWVEYGLGWYNVLDYGAVGDGLVDDKLAIQSAIDAADDNGGGVVYFPDGIYSVIAGVGREGILIGDNTTLLGNGVTSEILFTPDTLSSTAILNKNSSGTLTEAQQRVGNTNITIEGIKVRSTRTTEFLDIGINLSGVDGFLIRDVTVEDIGGYCYLIGRTNDDANIGTESKNGVIENIKALNFMDQGLELWGATNVRVNNVYASGTGTTTGFGQGLLIWHGAQDITASNITVYKVDAVGRNVAAIAVSGWGVTAGTVTGERKTKNIVIENVNALVDVGIRINSIYNETDVFYEVEGLVIRDSKFAGNRSNIAADIRLTSNLRIENSIFSDFTALLTFTSPSLTTQQSTCIGVKILNCYFNGNNDSEEGMLIYGLSNSSIVGNTFSKIGLAPTIKGQGLDYVDIRNNTFHDGGNDLSGPCVLLEQLNESVLEESEYVIVTNNYITYSDYTFLVEMQDATDIVQISDNYIFNSEVPEYVNAGTGTFIAVDNGVYTPNTSNEVNLDAGLSLSDFQFYRQGRIVHGFGRFTANPTAAVLTGFQISLPPIYNSQISGIAEISGIAVSGGTTNMTAEVFGNAGNNTIQVRWIATDLTAQDWSINFAYIVNPF